MVEHNDGHRLQVRDQTRPGISGNSRLIVECVKSYQISDANYAITWDDDEEDTRLSAVRSIHGIYNMDDVEHNIHAMAVKLMK